MCRCPQADPGLVEREPALVAEFAAAPWLLPPNCSGLPYIGVHDFDALLELRAGPAGGYDKAIHLLPFGATVAEFVQNAREIQKTNVGWWHACEPAACVRVPQLPTGPWLWPHVAGASLRCAQLLCSLRLTCRLISRPAVYTLVKFAGVHNYLFWTWTAEALAACDELNLPCADGMPHLLRPAEYGHHLTVSWAHSGALPCKRVLQGCRTGVLAGAVLAWLCGAAAWKARRNVRRSWRKALHTCITVAPLSLCRWPCGSSRCRRCGR